MASRNRFLLAEAELKAAVSTGSICVFVSHQREDIAPAKALADYLLNDVQVDVYFDGNDQALTPTSSPSGTIAVDGCASSAGNTDTAFSSSIDRSWSDSTRRPGSSPCPSSMSWRAPTIDDSSQRFSLALLRSMRMNDQRTSRAVSGRPSWKRTSSRRRKRKRRP